MSLACIIIDDELLAQNVLEKYIKRLSNLDLKAKFTTAVEAISFLQENAIDLIFLDINMPEYSGIDFLNMLDNPPKVIITTAHSEFAIQGFEHGVIDYLLKPIPFERFIKATNRVKGNIVSKKSYRSNNPEKKSFHIKENGSIYYVGLDSILYFEATGNYIKVITLNKTYIIRDKMFQLLDKLPEKDFIRVHRSYILNINHIKKTDGNRLFINDIEIPIGISYKQQILSHLGN